MAQDCLDSAVVGDADMVGLDPHYGTQLLVQLMDDNISLSSPDSKEKP
jgi:hypothetical protein